MNDAPQQRFAAWWSHRVELLREQPSLGAAVLSGRWLRYGVHRLRGFAVARGGGAMLHVLETLVIAKLASPHAVIAGFVIANLALLVSAAWWGATEVLRKRLRAINDIAEQDAEVASWLAWSFRMAVVVLAIGIYLGARLYGRGVVAPYVVAMIARVALDLPLRVWHARIAARGRVFRPPWIQVVIEAIGPLIVLALHSTAGRWTVLVSFVTASFASRVVMLVYVRRSYASHGYRWIGPRLAATRALPWFAIAGHAVAGIATRIPQMVGVALLAIHNLPSNIAVGLQLSIGVLTAATSWCWTHYHDLLPVQHAALYRFRRRIERSVQVESLIVGAIVGLATLAVVGWMTPREFIDPGNSDFIVLVPPTLPSPWPYAAMLPAVAIAMSWLSSMQVIAWTRDRLVAVTIGGGMIASVLTLAPRVAWWWHGGHGYHYDAPPSWLRSQQATLIAAMLVTGGLTLVWLRVARARVLRGRIAWIDGVVLARRGRDDVAVIGLARSGVLADRIGELSLTTGATWWARRERSILIAGMSRAAIADLAINTGGWIRSVRPWAEVEATASDGAMPVPRTDSITINIVDERAVMPPGMQLTRYQLSQLWSGLMAAMRGGATANVAVGGVVYRGDTIARCAVRLRA